MSEYYSRADIETELLNLRRNPDLIEKVYFGKQGCACGCRGTYSESKKSKLMAVNKLYKLAKGGEYIIKSEDEENANRTGILGRKISNGEGLISLELESRAIRIYYK